MLSFEYIKFLFDLVYYIITPYLYFQGLPKSIGCPCITLFTHSMKGGVLGLDAYYNFHFLHMLKIVENQFSISSEIGQLFKNIQRMTS